MTLENDAAQPIKWKVIFTKIFEGINFYECLHATKPSGFVGIFFFFFFLQTKLGTFMKQIKAPTVNC